MPAFPLRRNSARLATRFQAASARVAAMACAGFAFMGASIVSACSHGAERAAETPAPASSQIAAPKQADLTMSIKGSQDNTFNAAAKSMPSPHHTAAIAARAKQPAQHDVAPTHAVSLSDHGASSVPQQASGTGAAMASQDPGQDSVSSASATPIVQTPAIAGPVVVSSAPVVGALVVSKPSTPEAHSLTVLLCGAAVLGVLVLIGAFVGRRWLRHRRRTDMRVIDLKGWRPITDLVQRLPQSLFFGQAAPVRLTRWPLPELHWVPEPDSMTAGHVHGLLHSRRNPGFGVSMQDALGVEPYSSSPEGALWPAHGDRGSSVWESTHQASCDRVSTLDSHPGPELRYVPPEVGANAIAISLPALMDDGHGDERPTDALPGVQAFASSHDASNDMTRPIEEPPQDACATDVPASPGFGLRESLPAALPMMPNTAPDEAPVGNVLPDYTDCTSPMPATTHHQPAATAPAKTVASPTLEAIEAQITRSKRHLAADQPTAAIDALRPLLESSNATAEAWTVAGWSWWRIARDQSAQRAETAAHAVDAFSQAMAAEPERARMLHRAISRCYLLVAQGEIGAAREPWLDQALLALQQSAEGKTPAVASLVIDWANALLDRAATAADGGDDWLAKAEHLLRDFAAPREPDNEVDFLYAQVLLARAGLATPRAAESLYARSTALLRAGIERLSGDERDAWLAHLIDTERAHVARLRGAARIVHLKRLQGDLYEPLDRTQSIMPLLAWIRLLNDWAGYLNGPPAQSKQAEAEALFERIETLAPHDKGSIHFARAYFLRLRAQRELGSRQLESLQDAEKLLHGIDSPDIEPALIAIELAEILLARGRLLDGVEGRVALGQAAAIAAGAADALPVHAALALRCALAAELVIGDMAPPASVNVERLKSLAQRLVALDSTNGQVLAMVARVHLLDDQFLRACELCHAAWRTGAVASDVVSTWQLALSQWARRLSDPEREPLWTQHRRQQRMALNGT